MPLHQEIDAAPKSASFMIMKLRFRLRLAGAAVAGALGLTVPVLFSAEISPPGATTEPARPSPAQSVRSAYLAFVTASIVPADAHTVGEAALRLLCPGQDVALPAAFGRDATADADWLAARADGLSEPWPVVDAMARAARIVHLALVTPSRRQGLRALGTGDPLSSPGFNLHPLADGRLVVCDVVAGASAASSGLRAGDVLEEAAGRPAIPAEPFFINLLPAGTEVPLRIRRGQESSTIVLHLIKTAVSPVEGRLLDDGNAYVRVRGYARSADPAHDTAALFRHTLQELIDRGARGLVLDLRSSLGGSGEVNMASALCDGEIIYSIRKPLDAPARPAPREGARIWPRLPIAILQNRCTTSAGESFALALRELGQATVVGETSGGGLTEFNFIPLADGAGVIVPQGIVLGPVSGRCPPGYAVQPDLEIANPTIEELIAGRDRQLDAARAVLVQKR